MDLWSVIPIGVHQYTILSTMVSSIPLGNIWKWKLSSDFISSFNLTTSIHHTSMDILNLECMPCKQIYEMHIQMHHTSSWACPPTYVLKILIDPFSLSYLSAYVKFSPLLSFHYLSTLISLFFSPCTNITNIFVFLLLCHQWPQRLKL